jgi:hypothetical protein
MAMRVTIILETGGFLLNESNGHPYLDVGYFRTPGATDLEVYEDSKQTQGSPDVKLDGGNKRIEVQHVEADGTTVKSGVVRSTSFNRDILLKTDLYAPADVPDFVVTAYDCILRFYSGTFESADVRDRSFKEHRVSDDGYTGNKKPTRPIANEIRVQYDLGKGEIVRLRRDDETDLWSSASVGSGPNNVEVKVLSDALLNSRYHKEALNHKGNYYYLPNPDPPPMDSQ